MSMVLLSESGCGLTVPQHNVISECVFCSAHTAWSGFDEQAMVNQLERRNNQPMPPTTSLLAAACLAGYAVLQLLFSAGSWPS